MKRGFTLIELVVVMAILATLIGIGYSSFTNTLNKARDAKRKSDLRQIQLALEKYKNLNGDYPVSDWVTSQKGTSTIPWITDLTVDYIKELPVDPKNILSTPPGKPSDSGNYVYAYYSSDNVEGACPGIKGGDYYILATKLENPADHDTGQTMVTNTCKWPVDSNNAKDVYALSNP